MNKKPDPPVNKAGILVGGIVGGLVALILVIILIVVFIKSGKMGESRLGSIRRNRPKTDPDVKIRQTGSVLYDPIPSNDADVEKADTKVSFEEDPPIKTEEQTLQKESDEKEPEKPKDESPKETKKPEVASKPAKNSESSTPPPPPKSPPPPADSEA